MKMARLAAAIYFAAFTFGVVASRDPLIRLACALSLTATCVFLLAWRHLSVGTKRATATGILVAMLGSFGFVMSKGSSLGGSALNGRIEGGRHYLVQHGVWTAVSGTTYYGVATVETLMFVSWPLALFMAGVRRTSPEVGKAAVQQRAEADEAREG